MSSKQYCPGNPPRILALKEKRLGFAILEAKDLVISSNVELSLCNPRYQVSDDTSSKDGRVLPGKPRLEWLNYQDLQPQLDRILKLPTYLSRIDLCTTEGIFVGSHDAVDMVLLSKSLLSLKEWRLWDEGFISPTNSLICQASNH